MIIGFLRTVLLIAIFYYLVKFIGRILLPMFIANRVNKMNNPHVKQKQYAEKMKQQEGKVTIQNGKSNKKMTTDDMGEYVDYEEVK
ncbi:DUF4834 family protein [Plebeiibacterium marinum]|uniref:DUF4834 family protein n=1 Tax=Plebeiibacterium marinum TaxID=2992111 RepID=A0AAE3MHQ2_9BACT|nr:DUF4834 family protein [Plebeiobacterium marinum]MCW3807779.1 DUF4834 family protein [Plebeiobacterium marinum]